MTENRMSRRHLLEVAKASFDLTDEVIRWNEAHLDLLALLRLVVKMENRRKLLHGIIRHLIDVVAMVGDSSVGKSTIINTLLGRELLAEGSGHCTPSCIHIEYHNGTEEYFTVGDDPTHHNLDQLQRFSDSTDSEERDALYVYLVAGPHTPEDQKNLKIVDTPGMRSEDFHDNDELIDRADAYVLVVDAVSGLDERRTRKFIDRRLTMWKPSVTIAFNHFDRFDNDYERRERVMRKYLSQAGNILKQSNDSNVNVDDSIFFISAKEVKAGNQIYLEDFESFKRKILSDARNRRDGMQLDKIVADLVNVNEELRVDVNTLIGAIERHTSSFQRWRDTCPSLSEDQSKHLLENNKTDNLAFAKTFYDREYDDKEAQDQRQPMNRYQLLVNDDNEPLVSRQGNTRQKEPPKTDDHTNRTLDAFIAYIWDHRNDFLNSIVPFQFDGDKLGQVQRTICDELLDRMSHEINDYDSFARHVTIELKLSKVAGASVGGGLGIGGAVGAVVGTGVAAAIEIESIALGAAVGGPIGVAVGAAIGGIVGGSIAIHRYRTRVSRFQERLRDILGIWQIVVRRKLRTQLIARCNGIEQELKNAMDSLLQMKTRFESRMTRLNSRSRYLGNLFNASN